MTRNLWQSPLDNLRCSVAQFSRSARHRKRGVEFSRSYRAPSPNRGASVHLEQSLEQSVAQSPMTLSFTGVTDVILLHQLRGPVRYRTVWDSMSVNPACRVACRALRRTIRRGRCLTRQLINSPPVLESHTLGNLKSH